MLSKNGVTVTLSYGGHIVATFRVRGASIALAISDQNANNSYKRPDRPDTTYIVSVRAPALPLNIGKIEIVFDY